MEEELSVRALYTCVIEGGESGRLLPLHLTKMRR